MTSKSYNQRKLPPLLFSYIRCSLRCLRPITIGNYYPFYFNILGVLYNVCVLYPQETATPFILIQQVFSTTPASYNHRKIPPFIFIYQVFSTTSAFCVVLQGCPSPMTYELDLIIICPFPAILFSSCASYNLIIFYELALSLVICPFPAILFS